MSGYEPERETRGWVPGWRRRVFCVGNLATFTLFREILTRVPAGVKGP